VSEPAHRHGQRLTRRSFLAGSVAVATAGAAAAVVGYTRRGGKGATAGHGSALAPVVSRGGVLRAYTLDATAPDTLDPHLTQMGPVVNMHSAVFSKLLQYEDEAAGTIALDLCASMPEQPDHLTYIIKLRRGVRFHDSLAFRYVHPTAAGRELTADDVKFSIERQRNPSAPQGHRFFRRDQWGAIDGVSVMDDHTLTIKTKAPVAPFIEFLAGRHAFVIPQEITGQANEASRELDMLGSGPFLLDSWQPGAALKLLRNPAWFARDDHAASDGGGRPFLDGYEGTFSPQQDVFDTVVFEHKRIDSTGFEDPRALAAERAANLADITLEQLDSTAILASRLLLDRAPFKDDRVRRALHLAVDRQALVGALYPAVGGTTSARLSGPVAPANARWALSDAELARRPGYRGGADRAAGIAEARKLLSAALGNAPIPEMKFVFAGVPRMLQAKAAGAFQRQLQDTLGVHVTGVTDASGYVYIAFGLNRNLDGATEGVAPFTFMLEDGGVDLDDCLYSQFRSGQPMNTYRLEDATLDAMLDKQRREFDGNARRRQGLAIQDYLIANVNARLEYLAPIERRLTWGYVRNSAMTPSFASLYKLADAWLDTTHPAWRERPS
jgi:peptide/nickel transport system substrate-binding protein